MTQPMRAHYCAEYLRRRVDSEKMAAIVTDRQAFAGIDFPPAVDLVVVAAETTPPPSERVLRSRLACRVAEWMRSGSQNGERAERVLRTVMWKLRYVDRAVTLVSDRRATGRRTGEEFLAILEFIAADEPITELVAFDAFDLPVLASYAEQLNIPLLLR